VVPTLVDASNDAQMVVLGSSGRAFGRGMLGSVIAGLLHHANCAVAVVPDPESAQHGIGGAPVLVGINGSTASEAAVALAFDEASRRDVPVMALQAWSDVGVLPLLGIDWRTYRDKGAELLGERLAGWQERYPDVQVHRRLVCDVPDRWLIDESKNAQLVVLGSGGAAGTPGCTWAPSLPRSCGPRAFRSSLFATAGMNPPIMNGYDAFGVGPNQSSERS
jgi:nucleotide-binding universal stress UspA family protein